MKKVLSVFSFSFKNADANTVDIHIDGDIVDASTQEILKNWYGDETSVSFKSFRNQIESSGARTFNIYINSAGGHVGDAMAMHDLLIDMQGKGKTINTVGRGIVASAATYILMAGNNSEMSANSWFMIHNVSGGIWGDVNMIESYATSLRKFNDATRNFYANKTGMRKEDVTKMMDNETWMTAAEAKEKGFVKQVSADASFTNKIQKEYWNFSDLSVLNAYNSAVKAPEDNLSTQIQNQLQDMKKFFTDIVNAIKGVKPAENADQSALVIQIADSVAKPFENVADEIEKTITEQVNAAKTTITSEVTTAVTNTFEVRLKKLEDDNAALVKKNGELEAEITNKLGGQTKDDNKDEKAPIGSFVKSN
jgi:ATP-dependent Clp protease protease subunit